MTYDHEITLVGADGIIEDDIGNQIPVPIETTVLCDVGSIGRTEFYNAALTDIRPEIVFVVHGYEYNGEKKVIFEGVRYHVIRTYSNGFEEIELTCERAAGDG